MEDPLLTIPEVLYFKVKIAYASHNQLGKEAEEMAVTYLTKKGYEILHCNWRYSRYEIDIIATKNELLRIIEVKALKSSDVRQPEESVTKKKFRYLVRAADEFLFQNQQYRHVQFDILSIVLNREKEPEYFLIEDVFL
jgi:putative endonuclease